MKTVAVTMQKGEAGRPPPHRVAKIATGEIDETSAPPKMMGKILQPLPWGAWEAKLVQKA
jgi:hypothetical protein